MSSVQDIIAQVVSGGDPRKVLTQAIMEATPEGRKITIYMSGAAGNIGKLEGFLGFVMKHAGADLHFTPKGARKERVLMSYYTPWYMVVDGWGHPEPPSPMDPGSVQVSPGVTSYKYKYRSADPRWIQDFLQGPGKGLHPLATYDGHTLHNPGSIPVKIPDGHGGFSMAEQQSEVTVQMPGSVRTEDHPPRKFNVGDHVKVTKVPTHFMNRNWTGKVGRVGTQPGIKWDVLAGEWSYLIVQDMSGADRWWPESSLVKA